MTLRSIRTSARNAMCDGFVDDFDAGVAAGNADMQIGTATMASVLAVVDFSDPAFGAAGAVNPGEAVANTMTGNNAVATGTAAEIRFRDSDAATIADGDAGTAPPADLILNTTSFTTGDSVSVSGG